MGIPPSSDTSTTIGQCLAILGQVAQEMHQCSSVEPLLDLAVREARRLLESDRTLVYQLLPNGDGVVIAESVGAEWAPIAGRLIYDPCFQERWIEPYRRGRVSQIINVAEETIPACHRELLAQVEAQANLVVPILLSPPSTSDNTVDGETLPTLWGLLIAYQCSAPRNWTDIDVEVMKYIALRLRTELYRLQVDQSQGQWQRLLDALADYLIIADGAGQIIYGNAALEKGLGYSQAELLSMGLTDLCLPNQSESAIALIEKALTGETVRHPTLLLGAKNGHQCAVEMRLWSGVWDNRPAIFGVFRDVSDRQAAMQQAEQRMQLQTRALEACADGIVITDRYGTIEWVNPAFSELTGYRREEVIGRNPRQIVKSGLVDANTYRELWATILSGKVWRGELVNRRRDYSLYTEAMTITPVHNEQGAVSHFIAIKQNITERHQIEQHLRDRNAMLHKLSQQVPGVIYQYQFYPDGHSCFPYASEAIRQIYEVTPAQVQQDAQVVLERLHPEDRDRVIAHIQNSCQSLELWHDEYRVNLPERGLRWLEGHATPERLPDGSILWHGYIWDITERKTIEAHLHLEFQRERMIHLIDHHIRKSLDLDTILNTTVSEVRQFFNVDRVIIYRFREDWSGVVVAEAVLPEWLSILDMEITDTFLVETQGKTYHDNPINSVADCYTAGLSPCHVELLEQLQVRAKLVVPILQADRTWGLLIAHQCSGPREWQAFEGELLQRLARQLAIAIQQSELYHQVQVLNSQLELQVEERTAQLQRALKFESLLKRITDRVRDSLDEQQIIQTAVEELAYGLRVEAADAGVYDADQTTSTIAYEFTQTLSPAKGHTFAIADSPHPEIYPYLFRGEPCQFCDVAPNPLRIGQRLFTVLACPVIDDQGVLGDLWLFKQPYEQFDEMEVRLVQQVANQCAIALRQSRLYQTAQLQVNELGRLNQLKDDFLSTVSHELRTPMANIQMATQMLEKKLLPLVLKPIDTLTIHQYFRILQEETQREINLINNLLNLTCLDAGIEPLNLALIDLQFLVPHIAEPFILQAKQQKQKLELDIPGSPLTLVTDLAYLERSVTELLTNACKYTPAGETIRISLRALANTLTIAVSNSGVKIPASEGDRIFDKFYRIPNNDPWKYGGTGLGLALVKKMINYLGGHITLESTEDKVTTFTIHLPYSR